MVIKSNQQNSIIKYIVKRFYVISAAETKSYNEQTSCLFADMFCNQRRSIISTYVLIIDASKINTCVKGHM